VSTNESPEASEWDTLIEPLRVHRRLYVEEPIFRRELINIFGRCWVFVGHVSEIPEPHDFRALTVAKRPLIVNRGADGKINVIFNRCSHRGTQICREERGNTGVFACPYHGWTFNCDGSLRGQPHAEGYGGKATDGRWDLDGAVDVDVYQGLIFAKFSAGGPGLQEYLGNARPLIDQFMERSSFGPLTATHGQHRMLIRANWKTVWDNSTDGYHAKSSHRSITMLSRSRYDRDKSLSHFGGGSPDDTDMYQIAFENGHSFLDQSPAMGSRWNRARPMPGKEAAVEALGECEDLEQLLEDLPGPGWNLNIFPNLMFIGNQLVMVDPLETERCAMIWYATGIDSVPDTANTIRIRIAEDFSNLGEVDDVDIWERMQESFAIPEAEWVDMSRGLETDERDSSTGVVRGKVTSDAGMRSFYQNYKRLMVQPQRERP
jgi:nitrite reductase/ring-hydroxylating ferredoxin subunit